ncbi:erythromycin esterase family protein [Caldifermentibacillus hisashii]|uniref:erythromycin esterase family protein n=1 Tax=Caldifermentibacillus hisashii TaxID=996558 RepID=UPI003D196A88
MKKVDNIISEVKQNSIELTNIDSLDNYQFIKSLVKDKKYIFIGESSHLVKEYSIAKVNLVKFLHQKLGFKVIAFESELGDCAVGDYLSQELNPIDFMRGSIGRVWHNEYILELFDYIQKNKENNPLYLTGIDVQQSENKHFAPFLEQYFEEPYYKNLFRDVHQAINRMLNLKRIKKTPQIIEELNEIKEKTSILTKELEARPVSNNVLQKVIIRTLNNRADYLHFTITNGFSKVFQHREELMAGNFEFITKELYPEEKIIIWAHNLHIKRKSSANRLAAYSSFFENLPQRIKNDSFVLGLYAHKGKMGDYRGSDYPIKKANKKNLEWLLSHSSYQNFFIKTDLIWGQKKWQAFEGGSTRISFVPAEQYDGLLFFKTVNPIHLKPVAF